MERKEFDLVVLGGGPGGYVAAIRAAERGASVALVEVAQVGGTCLNRGCIPSKTLIASAEVLRKVKEAQSYGVSVGAIAFDYAQMNDRKEKVVERLRRGLEGLIQSHKIVLFKGFGKLESPHEVKVIGENEALLRANKIILATGSEPRALPHIAFDHILIHDSTSLLGITVLPKRLVIIGGGVIGCEFASLHRSFDIDVTILELLPSLLSTEGKSVGDALLLAFKKSGIKVETNSTVTKVEKNGGVATVILADGRSFEADAVLVSVGRRFNTDAIGLDKAGIIVEPNGTIPTNEKMQTNVPHIYAIGDITGKWLLAHVASHQGIIAADNITGHHATMDYRAVPSVTFTHPEIATVGMTLEKATAAGFDAVIGKFPFQALGKSLAALETDGFAQVVIAKSTGQILGAQVIGAQASTLIAQMAVAIQNELTIDSIEHTIHAHPTTSEAWLEAAFIASGMPLHFPKRIA